MALITGIYMLFIPIFFYILVVYLREYGKGVFEACDY